MMNLHPRCVLGQLSREDGITTSAIVLPGTVVLVVVALQAALWFLGANVAQNAAVEAYRVARGYQSSSDAGTASAHRVLTQIDGYLIDPREQVDRTLTDVTVTVTGEALSLIPGLPMPPVKRTMTGPIERWVPAP